MLPRHLRWDESRGDCEFLDDVPMDAEIDEDGCDVQWIFRVSYSAGALVYGCAILSAVRDDGSPVSLTEAEKAEWTRRIDRVLRRADSLPISPGVKG